VDGICGMVQQVIQSSQKDVQLDFSVVRPFSNYASVISLK